MADYSGAYEPGPTKDELTIAALRKEVLELRNRTQNWEEAYVLGLKHGMDREKEKWLTRVEEVFKSAIKELKNG